MSTLSVQRIENVQDFDFANTPFVTAFNAANGAYDASNASYLATNTAYNFANSVNTFAYGVAVNTAAAFAAANNVGPQIAPAFNTANAAYTAANNVGPQIAPAFNQANLAYTSSNSANSYANSTYVKLSAPNQTITGDLAITGNLTLLGNATTITSNNLIVNDSLIYLAANNDQSDVLDIGFVGHYSNGTANLHTGLFRDHSTKQYFLFNDLAGPEPETINDLVPYANGMINAVLNANFVTSNLTLGGANTINWITSGYGVANAAFGKANTALQNTSGTLNGSLVAAGSLTIGQYGTYQPGSIYSDTNWGMIFRSANSAPAGGSSFAWKSYDDATEFMRITTGGNVGIGITSPANKLHVVAASQASDADGLTKIESTTAANAVNASLTTKNWSGTSQMMQWENYGLRFGSRIKTNYGAGNIYFTVGNDSVAASLDTNSHFVVNGSARAPIFYDSDNTSFYVNPNSTSAVSGAILIGPNAYSEYTRIGGTGPATDYATLAASNGNLHIDSKNGYGLYLNYGSSGTISMCQGGGYTYSAGSMRSPIFYDSDDTGYYVNPNGTSYLYGLTVATGYAGNGSTLGSTAGSPVLYSNGQTSRSYEAHDFNTYPNLYSTIFCNLSASSNIPTGAVSAAMGYRFVMGAGDTTTRGFDLVGTSGVGTSVAGELFFRERATGTWNRTWHNNNAPGTVLQVQQSVKTDTFASSSTTYVDVTGMAVTITPKSTSSKIIVTLSIHGVTSNLGYVKLQRNGTDIAIGDAASNRIRCTVGNFNFGGDGNTTYCWNTEFIDSPATTSAVTYKLQFRHENGGSTWFVNRTLNDSDSAAGFRPISTITVKEIAQ